MKKKQYFEKKKHVAQKVINVSGIQKLKEGIDPSDSVLFYSCCRHTQRINTMVIM